MPHSYSSSNTNHHHPPRARIRGNNTRTFEPLSYKRTNVHTIVTIVRYKFRDTYSGSIKATKAGWFCWLQVHQWRSESPCMSSASAPCPKCWWYSLHSQTHTELTTNSAVRFISFYCLYTYFPAPFPLYHPSSSVYRRAFIFPPPKPTPPFFRPPRVQFEDRSRRVRSIDRSCRDRARRSFHYAACFRLFVSRLSNPRACNERSILRFDKYRGSVKFERGDVRRNKYSCEYSFVQRFALCVQKKKRKMTWLVHSTGGITPYKDFRERRQTWRQMWLRGISYARRNLEEFSARLQTCAKRRIGIAIRDIYVGSKGHIGTYINTHVCIHIAYIYVYTCVYTCIHIHVPNNTTHRGGKKTYIHIHIYTHDTPYTDGLLTYVFIARHSCLVGWTVTREPCYVPQSSQDIFLSTSFMVYGWLV